MSKPFDAATKRLVESNPLAWLACAGLPGIRARLLDADLSTVTSEADRIVRVEEPDYLAHLELQATYKADMSERVLLYNTLTFCKYKLPVQSVVFLLRKEADGPAMSGQAGYVVPQSVNGSLALRYRVVRLWELPVETVLAGPLATLPLAPLSAVTQAELPQVVRRMEARFVAEATLDEQDMLWTTTLLLLGLKLTKSGAFALLEGVRKMRESTTYMAILEEGAEEGARREARRILLRLGEKRFGAPDAATQARLNAITPVERLEQLTLRIFDVENWNALLAED